MNIETFIKMIGDVELSFVRYYKNSFTYSGEHSGKKITVQTAGGDIYREEYDAKESIYRFDPEHDDFEIEELKNDIPN